MFTVLLFSSVISAQPQTPKATVSRTANNLFFIDFPKYFKLSFSDIYNNFNTFYSTCQVFKTKKSVFHKGFRQGSIHSISNPAADTKPSRRVASEYNRPSIMHERHNTKSCRNYWKNLSFFHLFSEIHCRCLDKSRLFCSRGVCVVIGT